MRIGLSMWVLWGLVATPVAARADAASETSMALTHAYQAAQSTTMDEVHANLHQVVNCLVGPKDELFDVKERNPCAKAGKGAIADTTDPEKKRHLQDAVDMAQMGIVSNDVGKANAYATGAATALWESRRNRKSGEHRP